MKQLVFPAALAAVLLCLPPTGSTQNTEPKNADSKNTEPAGQPTIRDGVNALSEADLARVLPLLRQNYLAADKLTDTELSRATIQGLLERIAPGASILAAKPAVSSAPEAHPFRSEILPNQVAYVRLGALDPTHLSELDNALQKFSEPGLTEQGIKALVLDLRATPAGSEFEAAAEVCKRFCPKGKLLLTLKHPNPRAERLITSKDEPLYNGLLAILVDRRTLGAAEVIAAILRTHAKAMILGQTTKGEAAEFTELPLPSGKLLRIAVGEVALPDNVTVFPGGVKPELSVEVPQEVTDEVLKIGLEKGVKGLIEDIERLRLNEASLVAGKNPELEAYQAAQRTHGEKPKAVPRDLVLQRALDFISAVNVYETKDSNAPDK